MVSHPKQGNPKTGVLFLLCSRVQILRFSELSLYERKMQSKIFGAGKFTGYFPGHNGLLFIFRVLDTLHNQVKCHIRRCT